MKILITGGKGQLGNDCQRVLQESHTLRSIDLDELDITDARAVDTMVHDFGPDIILNCAAFTNVDACETQRESAWQVNVIGPRNLAQSADHHNARLVHISTDYVFSGRKKVPQPYVEKDVPNPISNYGHTKLEGEKAVKQATVNNLIVRSAWMYGLQGRNFRKTMLRLALKDPRKTISVVNDQFGSPTWSYSLALQLENLIQAGVKGTYHATSEGSCTWYELTCRFLEKIEIAHQVIPCTTEEYPLPAARPKNSILENERLKKEGLHCMTEWRKDLDTFTDRFGQRLLDEPFNHQSMEP